MGEGPGAGARATTLRVVYGYLSAIFASAVRDRLIASSPCVDIRLPGIDRGKRRPADLVFRAASGGPVNASTFSRTWTPVRAEVGLRPPSGFHGLRHYYDTLLIHAGASVKTVQLALGHSTSTITLNEYVHEWPDVLDRARALVDGALGGREAAATWVGNPA